MISRCGGSACDTAHNRCPRRPSVPGSSTACPAPAVPSFVATAIWGLTAGLEPPMSGCAWQPAQLSRLNRGPRPASVSEMDPWTDATSWKTSFATGNTCCSKDVRPGSIPPAPVGLVRTLGSRAVVRKAVELESRAKTGATSSKALQTRRVVPRDGRGRFMATCIMMHLVREGLLAIKQAACRKLRS